MFVVAGVALRQLSIKVYQEIGKILSMKVELGEFRADFNKSSSETKEELSKLTQEIRGMQAELKITQDEVSDAQQRISDIEDKESIKIEILTYLLVQQNLMSEKLSYLESKSRQCNVRIHQVKERVEGDDMVKFVYDLISANLGIPEKELIVVAAHRSLQKMPEEGATPRSIVVRGAYAAAGTERCLGQGKNADQARR